MMRTYKEKRSGVFAFGIGYTKLVQVRDYLERYKYSMHAIEFVFGPFVFAVQWETSNDAENKLRKAND
jgi:hypothetical protein